MNGVDFSWARPGGAAIAEAGNQFVFRYVPYEGDGGKGLTADEVADYHAHQLGIGLVFESTASRHLLGYGAGVVDAQAAEAGRKSIGYPDNLPIYFAVDFDAQSNQMNAIDQYQAGAASVLGKDRVGIYGSYDVIEHCHLNDSAAYFWQTYAWSRGREHPFYDYLQYENGVALNSGEVDLCKGHGAALWQADEEEEMPDPRVDAIIAALTGDPKDTNGVLANWNGPATAPSGNSLLLGYTLEQNKLAEHIAGVDKS